MSDLAEWLRAQLEEDERIAQAAIASPWSTFLGAVMSGTPPNEEEFCNVFGEDLKARDDETVEHIARHDPARVLAEVDAKRRIIEQYEASVRSVGPHLSRDLERILRLLALPYADRPGYKKAWRP